MTLAISSSKPGRRTAVSGSLRSFFHILNPSARERRAVRRFFRRHPELECIWVDRKEHPEHVETIVNWALVERRSGVAIWGGDGTLNRVVNALYGYGALSALSVAIVPAGTCNDFARRLGVPPWRKRIDAALSEAGVERAVDVGVLESEGRTRAFLNNSGFGRPRAAIDGRRSRPVRDILALRPTTVELDWPEGGGRNFEARPVVIGMACNGPFFSGGLAFNPLVEPDDGKLSFFFEPPRGRFRFLWRFFAGRLGRPLESAETFRIDATELHVRADSDLFPQVDGELAFPGPARDLSWRVVPGALRFHTWPANR